MSSGVIPAGAGWEFVWTAYAVTVVVLAGYVLSVLLRYRNERSRAEVPRE